jgi:hypothetical protein
MGVIPSQLNKKKRPERVSSSNEIKYYTNAEEPRELKLERLKVRSQYYELYFTNERKGMHKDKKELKNWVRLSRTHSFQVFYGFQIKVLTLDCYKVAVGVVIISEKIEKSACHFKFSRMLTQEYPYFFIQIDNTYFVIAGSTFVNCHQADKKITVTW